MRPRFPLGSLLITPAALQLCGHEHIDVFDVLVRHGSGDWSEMTVEDQQANERAIGSGERIFSAFTYGKTRIWCVTEADRSSTTVLRPEDY